MDTSFVWDQHFVTQLDSVDEQHHALVQLFNALSQGLFSTRSDREVVLAETYQRLLSYTEHHFQEEEALMAAFQVDARHIESHRSMHQQFVEQVVILWSQRRTMSDPATTLVGFLTSWLGLHILGIDQSMARQIHSIRCGMSPAQAYEKECSTHDNSTQALLKMIGKLYTALSAQNAQLAQANQDLEARVAQRTAELQAANAQLQRLSRTDGLLGIANRSYFNERLEHACAVAHRSGRPLGLLLVDVDHFKLYNDHYGHLHGDVCLQTLAACLSQCAQRETDLVARYGGEEMAVLLEQTDAQGTLKVAQRMVQAVRQLRLLHVASPSGAWVSVSVGGVAAIPVAGSASGRGLLRVADQALYQAKSQGRNRAVTACGDAVH